VPRAGRLFNLNPSPTAELVEQARLNWVRARSSRFVPGVSLVSACKMSARRLANPRLRQVMSKLPGNPPGGYRTNGVDAQGRRAKSMSWGFRWPVPQVVDGAHHARWDQHAEEHGPNCCRAARERVAAAVR